MPSEQPHRLRDLAGGFPRSKSETAASSPSLHQLDTGVDYPRPPPDPPPPNRGLDRDRFYHTFQSRPEHRLERRCAATFLAFNEDLTRGLMHVEETLKKDQVKHFEVILKTVERSEEQSARALAELRKDMRLFEDRKSVELQAELHKMVQSLDVKKRFADVHEALAAHETVMRNHGNKLHSDLEAELQQVRDEVESQTLSVKKGVAEVHEAVTRSEEQASIGLLELRRVDDKRHSELRKECQAVRDDLRNLKVPKEFAEVHRDIQALSSETQTVRDEIRALNVPKGFADAHLDVKSLSQALSSETQSVRNEIRALGVQNGFADVRRHFQTLNSETAQVAEAHRSSTKQLSQITTTINGISQNVQVQCLSEIIHEMRAMSDKAPKVADVFEETLAALRPFSELTDVNNKLQSFHKYLSDGEKTLTHNLSKVVEVPWWDTLSLRIRGEIEDNVTRVNSKTLDRFRVLGQDAAHYTESIGKITSEFSENSRQAVGRLADTAEKQLHDIKHRAWEAAQQVDKLSQAGEGLEDATHMLVDNLRHIARWVKACLLASILTALPVLILLAVPRDHSH